MPGTELEAKKYQEFAKKVETELFKDVASEENMQAKIEASMASASEIGSTPIQTITYNPIKALENQKRPQPAAIVPEKETQKTTGMWASLWKRTQPQQPTAKPNPSIGVHRLKK